MKSESTPTDQALQLAEDSKPIETLLDEAYNKGVDDCIKFVEMGLDHSDLVDDRPSVALLNALITKLKELKTKPV